MNEHLVSIYRDASAHKPYGRRWKALWVSKAGDLTGQPVRNAHGEEAEFCSMADAVEYMMVRHGSRLEDLFRVFLPRYEGKSGHYSMIANHARARSFIVHAA